MVAEARKDRGPVKSQRTGKIAAPDKEGFRTSTHRYSDFAEGRVEWRTRAPRGTDTGRSVRIGKSDRGTGSGAQKFGIEGRFKKDGPFTFGAYRKCSQPSKGQLLQQNCICPNTHDG